jgi:KGK domain
MNNLSKQIIPDSQAVARCLDPEMLEILGSHGTFVISDILERMKFSSDPKISKAQLDRVFDETISSNSNQLNYIFDTSRNGVNKYREDFFKNLTDILTNDTDIYELLNKLIDGTTCNLLQPDGKGWQKGKLKICFEFIPEEPEDRHSPLDEIRQLSNASNPPSPSL